MNNNGELDFFIQCLGLKEQPRNGWRRRGISDGESVADHTLMMLLMMLWKTEGLPAEDRLKALEMVIAHDLPEAIMGDYTPADKVPIDRKRTEESLAMDYLQCLSSSETIGTLRDRLAEYNEHQTPISSLVHQVDKLEPCLQALRYQKTHPDAQRLEDFQAHTEYLKDPALVALGRTAVEQWNLPRLRLEYIFLIGGPGVGKGTQCQLLSQENTTACFSLGELLREEKDDAESQFKDFIERSFKEGVAVPGSLAMRILRGRIAGAADSGKSIVVLDGFPRSLKQLREFMAEISPEFCTLYLRCAPDVLSQRLETRAQSSSRTDDLDASVRSSRAKRFEAESQALITELKKYPFREIDGSRAQNDVANDIQSCLQSMRADT
ncbi:uncharacterized protein JN550_010900 [Neoarthrinium moseri]|uniref:uncharacterized protein n=1 Tax=Neoarthrinium moseri TaxID=1658444 RepID=UPI001FDE5B28|nr:uncharacterized protein JN550_010900 [Neoarthrinium moseri]KAI1861370.1 hypothetical protein JN550_010900 [Neoarthrinium moseri]